MKVPWQHGLAPHVAVSSTLRPTYAEAAKQARNRLRRYSLGSIITRALALLRSVNPANKLEHLETYPWITLLLVKLALEDKTIPLDRGEVCPQEEFDRCRKTLWDAQSVSVASRPSGEMQPS